MLQQSYAITMENVFRAALSIIVSRGSSLTALACEAEVGEKITGITKLSDRETN